ncbi:hypothetical protein SK128_007646, partial [Halocaridina rubra]
MKERLDQLITEYRQLTQEEVDLRAKFSKMEEGCEKMKSENDILLNKALEMHDLLKGLAGRPLPLPPVVAALHNPPSPPIPTRPLPKGSLRTPIMTKAAAKMMMTEQVPPVGDSGTAALTLNRCRVCQQTKEQHLLIECDTCGHYYHLSCLDPPLTRMPKKTKQMGWQCSDCCKSDSDKASEVDTAAPRRLRRNIKEPAKFSPSVAYESKISEAEKNQQSIQAITNIKTQLNTEKSPSHLYHPGVASLSADSVSVSHSEPASSGVKRRQSTDGKKGSANKRRKSQGESYSEPAVGNSMSMEPSSLSRGKREQNQLIVQEDTSQIGKGIKVSSDKVPPQDTSETTKSPGTTSSSKVVSQEASKVPGSKMEDLSSQVPQASTSSPSRLRRLPPDTTVTPLPGKLSSPSRGGRKSQVESNTELPEVKQSQNSLPVQGPGEVVSSALNAPVSNGEAVDLYNRRRGGSSIHLDTSIESLPSAASLNSPTSESFYSAEDDPCSPRKEKRHRDGSKKKKKDKDKDKEQKRKKHHHRDKHLGEMASEMVTPVRIKIKPLPPRPSADAAGASNFPSTSSYSIASSSSVTSTSSLSSVNSSTTVTPSVSSVPSTVHSSYQTVTPPAGYPPLPPGYTLTQPMAPPATASSLAAPLYSSTT